MVSLNKLIQLLCIVGFLQLVVVSAAAIPATAINFGETVTGTISSLGQTYTYTFTAAEGDTIFTRMQTSWYNGPRIWLYDPNGILITDVSGTSDYSIEATTILPMSGTYTLMAGDITGDVIN